MNPLYLLGGAVALFVGYQALKGRAEPTEDTGEGPTDGHPPPVPPHPPTPKPPPGGIQQPTGAPRWTEQVAATVRAKAEELYAQRPDKTARPGALFVVTRDTLMSLYPDQPWPKTMSDLETVSYGPGLVGPKWTYGMGAQGNALAIFWDKAAAVVNKVFGYEPPVS